jgi:type II secretory pathway predicted ATPase ExeA
MSPLIDDAMVVAARQAALKGYTKAQCSILPEDIRAALDAALPMIGAKLAKDFANGTKPNYIIVVDDVVARIRELTGAKP